MSQRQDELRDRAQEELYAELGSRSQPLRDQIAELERRELKPDDIETQIASLKKKIADIYEPHRDFLTRV